MLLAEGKIPTNEEKQEEFSLWLKRQQQKPGGELQASSLYTLAIKDSVYCHANFTDTNIISYPRLLHVDKIVGILRFMKEKPTMVTK